jgi:phosphatidylserine/phosphatidylglycerophosphate/cardiolipin synthase-like enzyme
LRNSKVMAREGHNVICILLLILFLVPCETYGTINAPSKTCLSPGRDCAEAIVKEINNAKSEVLVLAYAFTSAPISRALSDAHKRGVKVGVILGKSQRRDNRASAAILANMKVPTYIDDKHSIADSEIMIIDQSSLITGPFDSGKASEEKSVEKVLFIKSKDLAKTNIQNWSLHRGHSKPYQANQVVVSKGKR